MSVQKKYQTNNYRFRKLGEKFLVTTEHGTWTMLSDSEFQALTNDNLDEDSDLFKSLEKEGIVITDGNREGVVESLREKKSFLFQGTSLHIIVPTLRCNQNCIYCQASSRPERSDGYDMDRETAKKVVDFIFQSPSHFINIEFQGGEPLLRFDTVKYIIEYAKDMNKKYNKSLRLSLVSNMTMMSEEKLKYLMDNLVGMCASLDGPATLHNKNRPYAKGNSHELTIKWLQRINEEWSKRQMGRRANALITITSHSLPHWKEIVDEYLKVGVYDIFFRYVNNLGTARNTLNKISYTSEEFIGLWKNAMDYIIELNKKGKGIREWFTWIILRKIMDNEEPNFMDQRSPCGAAIGQLAYNYNGDIYSCDEARMIGEDVFKLGNVKKDSHREVMTSNKVCGLIASSVNDTQICDACVFKPYCGLCPVCNYSEQGSIIAKIPMTSRCKIFMQQFEYVFQKLNNDKEARSVFSKWLEKP